MDPDMTEVKARCSADSRICMFEQTRVNQLIARHARSANKQAPNQAHPEASKAFWECAVTEGPLGIASGTCFFVAPLKPTAESEQIRDVVPVHARKFLHVMHGEP